MEIALSIIFLATFTEGLIEYIAGKAKKSRPYIKYVALAIGVALAIAYKVDIPGMVGLTTPYLLANYIVSGIIIGRGSNYVHDVLSTFTASKG